VDELVVHRERNVSDYDHIVELVRFRGRKKSNSLRASRLEVTSLCPVSS
jgi:hypothetical protein